MHRCTALCAALLLVHATVALGTVRHYVFGLDPYTAYDVWQGEQLIAEGKVPGSAGDIQFDSPTVSPIAVLPSGAPLDLQPPAAVTDLTVSQSTQTSITLTWTAVGDDGHVGQASTYDLRHATWPITNGNWGSASQVQGEPSPKQAGQIETFTVNGLAAGTTYYFALKVADEVPNWSGLSNVPSGTTLGGGDTAPPASVTNLSVTNTTQSSATLAWTAVGDDGYVGQASTYDLRYATWPITTGNWGAASQADGEPIPKPAGQAETFVVQGLAAGTTYYFALKVADEVPNWSGLSNIPSGTTQPQGDTDPPAAVTNLSLMMRSVDSLLLTWTAVGDDGTEGKATSYDLRYATSPITAETWPAATQAQGEPDPLPAGEQEIFLVDGLEIATVYYFALKVADEVPNWSGLSNILRAETLPTSDEIPPDAVENLQVLWTSHEAVALTWSATGDDGSEGQATVYDLRYATSPITAENWENASQVEGEPNPKPAGQAETFAVHGLNPQTTYYFTLNVGDEAPNWSGLSNQALGTTLEQDLVPPAEIEDLAVADSTETSLLLTWTAVGDDGEVGGAATYDLRYAAVPISEESWDAATQAEGEPIPGAAGETESFVLSDLEPGTTYYLALKAGDEVPNWSGLSNLPTGTTLPPPPDEIPPGAVTDLQVIATTEDSATLTWTAVGDDGEEGQATVYDIRCGTVPITEATWETAIQCVEEPDPQSAGETEVFEVEDLAANTTYYFAMKVGDEVPNWSGVSNVSSAQTKPIPDVTAPTVVDDLHAQQIHHRWVRLAWTAPADDSDTESSAAYEGRFDPEPIDEESWEYATPISGLPTPSVPGEIDSVLVEGLSPGTTYFFAIRARDEVDNIAPIGNVLEITTTSAPDTIPPARITDLVGRDATNTTITLQWHAPADSIPEDCLETPEVIRYEFRYATIPLDGDGWNAGTIVDAPDPAQPGTLQQLTVEGLLPETIYYFGIRSVDRSGNWSETSNIAEQATAPPDELPDSVDPGAITDLAVASTDFDHAVLRWTATGGDGDVGQADHYDIRRAFEPLTGEVWENATPILPPPPCKPAGEPETLRVEGLDPETTYYLAMQAVDASGNRGPVSTSVEARTIQEPDTHAPMPVTDLEALDSDTTSILVQWTAPEDDRGRCASYQMRYATSPIDETTWEAATPVEGLPVPADPGTTEAYRVTGLPPGTALAFALRAIDRSGNRSEISNIAWGETDPPSEAIDMVRPARIDDLLATILDENRVRLTWTAVGDDGTEGRASVYELRRSLAPIDSTTWQSATPVSIPLTPGQPGQQESFIVTGLAPDTDHHFVLRARDDADNLSTCSSDAMAHTPPVPDTSPPSPPTEISATLSDDTVHLSWPPSPEPDVVQYILYRRETTPGSTESVAFLDLVRTEFVDALVLPEVTYAYTVAAKDAVGNVSAKSGEVFVQTRLEGFLPEIVGFAAQGAVTVTEGDDTPWVRLVWTATAGRRFAGFIVERSEDAGASWEVRTPNLLAGQETYAYEEPIDPGTYLYRISALSPRGYERTFEPLLIRWTGIVDRNRIEGPYPNPSPGAVTVSVQLARRERVRVVLYEPSGRLVGTLRDEVVEPGLQPWSFDPESAAGSPLASGLYFLRVDAGSDRFVRKLILRK